MHGREGETDGVGSRGRLEVLGGLFAFFLLTFCVSCCCFFFLMFGVVVLGVLFPVLWRCRDEHDTDYTHVQQQSHVLARAWLVIRGV